MISFLALLATAAVAAQDYTVPETRPPYPNGNPSYYPGNQQPPGRRHGHNHRSRSDSDSHSHSNSRSRSRSDERDCGECENLRHHCHHNGGLDCVKPKTSYVYSESKNKDRKSCRQVVISCNKHGFAYSLETPDYEQFFNGQGFSILATCGRHGKWEARTLTGQKAHFNRVYCVQQASSGYGQGAPNPPAYPPPPPVYPNVPGPPAPPTYNPTPPSYPDEPSTSQIYR